MCRGLSIDNMLLLFLCPPCCVFIMCLSKTSPLKWKKSILPIPGICSIPCEVGGLNGDCTACYGPLREVSSSRQDG